MFASVFLCLIIVQTAIKCWDNYYKKNPKWDQHMRWKNNVLQDETWKICWNLKEKEKIDNNQQNSQNSNNANNSKNSNSSNNSNNSNNLNNSDNSNNANK